MRVLLDECLPKKLTAHIVANLVQTVPEAGWAGKLPLMPDLNRKLPTTEVVTIEYVR